VTLPMNSLSLVLGGARSGKSQRAETLALESGKSIVYVATCSTQNLNQDSEMTKRIEIHRQRRPSEWVTVEDEYDLVLLSQKYSGCCFILDCLTLWLSAQWVKLNEVGKTLDLLKHNIVSCQRLANWVIVSNEIGMGLVPLGEGTREFRDLSGKANQIVAHYASSVEFMVAGLPLRLK
jgi:adenosylcobinamide kinase / adenosylcobinamide-phosphate guanylyltransferase